MVLEADIGGIATIGTHPPTTDRWGEINEKALDTTLDPVAVSIYLADARCEKYDPKLEPAPLTEFWLHHFLWHDSFLVYEIGTAIETGHSVARGDDMDNDSYHQFLGLRNKAQRSCEPLAKQIRKYYGEQYTMRKIRDQSLTTFENVVYEYATRQNPKAYKQREFGMLAKLYKMYMKDKELDRCKALCTPFPDTEVLNNPFYPSQPREVIKGSFISEVHKVVGGYMPLPQKTHMAFIVRGEESGYMTTMMLAPSPANYYMAKSLTQSPYLLIDGGVRNAIKDHNGFIHLSSRGGNLIPYDQ